MGRKLTKNEKILIVMLIAALLALGYYYLFWNNINKKIESEKAEIATLQIVYDAYQKKINGLAELKVKLTEMQNQPSYIDKFFSYNENQETYLDFLHKLVTDNKLTLEGITFLEKTAEMPAAQPEEAAGGATSEGLQTPAPAVSEETAHPPLGFIVTSAIVNFEVDYNAPQRLLNALTTIETYEKMILVSNLNVSVAEGDNNAKTYRCNADILFVSLALPLDDASAQDEDEQEADGAPA
ncbi:MAG: hypothetical protein LBU32_23855 [Clostridiales bacterium]|jgi:hypothetical protein|nr:hypothetical protein [Clostridiales bacterium]